MISKIVKNTHLLALLPVLVLPWFGKDVPLGIVLLASVGPLIDLVGVLLANRFNKDAITAKTLQLEIDVKDLKEKINNVLLAQQMGRM